MEEISFEQWKKLDIRVGEILEVEDHPHADRLYVMTIDIGKEKRRIVAGIKICFLEVIILSVLSLTIAVAIPTL